MLKNLKKRRALLVSQGELTEAHGYNFFPVSFELPKVMHMNRRVAADFANTQQHQANTPGTTRCFRCFTAN